MKVRLIKSWQTQLADTIAAPYFDRLTQFVRQEYKQYSCYPPGKDLFNAFDLCPFEAVNVVLLGQDPYHGPGQAHGLCFSVPEGIAHPPSLINILKELQQDVGKPYPRSGSLLPWASQGVLLLNATLTVRAGQAGSHQKQGWEKFTDAVIEKLSSNKTGLVFMLWGNYAKQKGKHINRDKHLVLEAGHPSPLSANRGMWFGNKHFSLANAYLKAQGKPSIDW
jgi:uracil-DNA glycosylase